MASYQDLSGLSTKRTKRKVNPRGITFHHTASQHTNPQTISALNRRNLSSNFVMDREGQIAFGTAPGAYASHMRPDPTKTYNNSNMLGIEVSALNDKDITQGQIDAAKAFAADMGMTHGFDPGVSAFGHGEVNPHKQATEGYSIANAVRQQHPQTTQAALMSPAPMASQYAPDFGMWGGPAVPGLTAQTVGIPTTREQGPFSMATMPGAIDPTPADFTPGVAPSPAMAGFAPSPETFGMPASAPPSAMVSAPPSSLQPNIDKAKQMLAGLPDMGPAPTFGAPPAATQAEMNAAKAALTAGLSGPQSVATSIQPGLTDAQIGMASPAQATVDPTAAFGALSPNMAMTGPAPMAGLGPMPGAISPMSAALQGPTPTVSAPQQQMTAPSAQTFGAPPDAISAPAMPMARPPGLMAAPQVTVAAPQQENQVNAQQQNQAAPADVSVTAGAHSAADFARAMAGQVAAKTAAVNSAGPEAPGGVAGALSRAMGGMFGGGMGAARSAGGSAGSSGGGSRGGSSGGSKSSGGRNHGGGMSRDSSKGSQGRSTGSRNKAR